MTVSLGAAVLVGVGGVAGAIARYGVGTRLPGQRATLLVNVLGSIALGTLVAAGASDAPALLAGTGFCGAFTTFSSFAVEVVERADSGDVRGAVWYAGVTLGAALVGVAIGFLLGGSLVGG